MNDCKDKNCPYFSLKYGCQAVIKCCELPFHVKVEITKSDIERLLDDYGKENNYIFLPLLRALA